MAHNPTIPLDALRELKNDESGLVRIEAMQAIMDRDWIALASDTHTSQETLSMLANDSDENIRCAAIHNPSNLNVVAQCIRKFGPN